MSKQRKKYLTFDEAVQALAQSSFTICLAPIGSDPIVVEYIGWEEESDEDSDYIVQPQGCDAIYMTPGQQFEITQDGRGFCVPGHALMFFPNKPFNFFKA